MLYVNWEKIQQKYIEYWNCENHDRPLISITVPKSGYVPEKVKAPENIRDRWLDTDYIINTFRADIASTFFAGEAYPLLNPNLGPDIFGAMLGCELEFGEDTSWSDHIIHDWNNIKNFAIDTRNKWYQKIIKMTEEIANDAKEDYFVGITDLHPGADGLVALRGPENLCMDLYDHPGEVKKYAMQLFNIFKKITDELYSVTTRNLKGSSNWMGIWHPGKWYVTSSDFICMISNDMFDEFILPELLAELDYLDASVFHLDGPQALKHLDTLLKIPKLKGIQWVYGAGQPTASHWIPVLKKIQAAGKLIHVNIVPEDLDILLAELSPEGVMYSVRVGSEEEATDILKRTVKSYRKKQY